MFEELLPTFSSIDCFKDKNLSSPFGLHRKHPCPIVNIPLNISLHLETANTSKAKRENRNLQPAIQETEKQKKPTREKKGLARRNLQFIRYINHSYNVLGIHSVDWHSIRRVLVQPLCTLHHKLH